MFIAFRFILPCSTRTENDTTEGMHAKTAPGALWKSVSLESHQGHTAETAATQLGNLGFGNSLTPASHGLPFCTTVRSRCPVQLLSMALHNSIAPAGGGGRNRRTGDFLQCHKVLQKRFSLSCVLCPAEMRLGRLRGTSWHFVCWADLKKTCYLERGWKTIMDGVSGERVAIKAVWTCVKE